MTEKSVRRRVDFAKFTFAALLCLFANMAFAQNHHEHLFALPRSNDFKAAILNQAYQGPSLEQVFGDPDKLQWYLLQIGSKELHFPSQWSLGRFLRYLLEVEKLPIDHVLSFSESLSTAADNRLLYDHFSEIRKQLFLSVDESSIEKIFTSYIQNEDPTNLRPIKASLSPSALDQKQMNKLRIIHRLIQKAGGTIEFYFSLQREKWLKQNWVWQNEAEQLKKEGLLTAIDLTGSLYENRILQEDTPVELYKQRFIELFDFVRAKQLRLRLHIFEHSNSGPFYEGLKAALQEYNSPLTLEIAHMNRLSRDWLEFFIKLPHHFEFQATPASYALLASSYSQKSLLNTIHRLSEYGYSTQFGFDGRGIFENTWPKSSPGICSALFSPR